MIQRLIHAISLTLLACLVVGGYMALRAVVWHYESEAAAAAIAGARVALVAAGVVSAVYLVIGAPVFRWFTRQIDWLSLQLGMMVGAGLYAVYSAAANPVGTAIDPLERALQGAMDGLLLGAGIGLIAYLAVGRRARLTFTGIIEFVALFLIMLCALQLAQMVESLGGVFDSTAGLIVLVPVALLIRLVVYLFTRRAHPASHDAEPAPSYEPDYETSEIAEPYSEG